MARIVLSNAFSVNMLKHDALLFFGQADLEMAKASVKDGFYSIIGHQSTADLLSAKLNVEVKLNRENYKKEKDDIVIVCLPSKRLEEGKVLSLEELNQIDIKFWIIK
jgi:hypothetical protein